MSYLKTESNKAPKEWGVVVKALCEGKQIVLIRRKRTAQSMKLAS